MPLNKAVLSKLEEFNIDIPYAKTCIEANWHNDITTTYYLLLKKLKEEVGTPDQPKLILPYPPLLPFPQKMNHENGFLNRKRVLVETAPRR